MKQASVIIAKQAGFCPGVSRAVQLMETELAKNDRPLFCLGELIHNRSFIESLRRRGVHFIEPEDIPSLPENALLFIRAHGTTKEVYESIRRHGTQVVDATCPYVKKIHDIAASCRSSEFIIIGDRNHPEVQGIISSAPGKATVYAGIDELRSAFPPGQQIARPAVLAAQTTFNTEEWKECRAFLQSVYPDLQISDTVCSVTETRQTEVRAKAAGTDLTVIVGSRDSSNSVKLFHIAESVCKHAIMIETADELPAYRELIQNANNILISAGASTPGNIIQEVYTAMTEIMQEEASFEELLNASFKTLHTGDKVVGIVSAVSPAELKVDLGTKHTGILPYDEITDESGIDLTEKYHVGDQIEVVCIKFSDLDGTVQLSSKRLESSKGWQTAKAAYESGEILTGVVHDVIRKDNKFSGFVVMKGATRVFIPASQSGIGKDEDPDQMRGKKVSFKIIDVNEERRRSVGSIKAVAREEKKQAEEEFYKTLEVGQKFVGTVRAVMTYGAFVNIGPVDGMVHVSELTWGRLRPPTEILTVGQKLNVFIKSFDPETKRISLGHKTPETNPWNIFLSKFAVGDVVEVTINSLMNFGAFAEIIPGLDGLIHNSQISNQRVDNPQKVLKVGDHVTVKILSIDQENKRINLSIKALLEPEFVEESAEETKAEEAPAEEAPAEAAPETAPDEAKEAPVEEAKPEEAPAEEPKEEPAEESKEEPAEEPKEEPAE